MHTRLLSGGLHPLDYFVLVGAQTTLQQEEEIGHDYRCHPHIKPFRLNTQAKGHVEPRARVRSINPWDGAGRLLAAVDRSRRAYRFASSKYRSGLEVVEPTGDPLHVPAD